MRGLLPVFFSTLSCAAASPAVTTACADAEGRAAISRDGQWVVLAKGDDVLVFSGRGKLEKSIPSEVHHALDAFFLGGTHVVAVAGTDDGGWHHAVLSSVPDGATLAQAGEIASFDARTGVVVYFGLPSDTVMMHTLDVVTRKELPNGARPQAWTNPDVEKPASQEDPRAREIVNAALCKVTAR